jgi:hypothetical protein
MMVEHKVSLVKDKTIKIELLKNVVEEMATIEMKPMFKKNYIYVLGDESSFF